jgi:vacuolar-type H+-ATPase subunit H
MNDEIYKNLVSFGRQDLANKYLSMKNEKEANDKRKSILENAIKEIKKIILSKISAAPSIEKVFSIVKDL